MLVKRKKGEPFEGFLRRFNRVLLHSGRLLEARKVRFYKRPKSKSAQKESALRRIDVVGRNEYLARIGKLPELKQRRPPNRLP